MRTSWFLLAAIGLTLAANPAVPVWEKREIILQSPSLFGNPGYRS